MPDLSDLSDLSNFSAYSFDLSFKTVALAIFVVFAVRAFVKGVVRQLWGMVCLAAGGVAGYYLFQNGTDLLSRIGIEHPTGNAVLAASLIGGCAVWLGGQGIVRKVYRGLTNEPRERSLPGRLIASTASLAPAAFLIWVVATALRLSGTMSEMGDVERAIDAETGSEEPQPSLLARLRRELDSGTLGRLLDKTDPFASRAGHQLAALLTLYRDPAAWERVKDDPRVQALLANEGIRRVLDDKEVKKSVAFSEHATLLTRPEIEAAVRDPAIAGALSRLDVRTTAENALFEAVPDAGRPEGKPAKKRRRPNRMAGRRR